MTAQTLKEQTQARARELLRALIPDFDTRKYSGEWLRGPAPDFIRQNSDSNAFGVKVDGHWKDFVSGEGGDIHALVARANNLDPANDFKAILEIEASILGIDTNTNGTPATPPAAPDKTFRLPRIGDKYAGGTITGVWPYTDALSNILYYAIRRDYPTGEGQKPKKSFSLARPAPQEGRVYSGLGDVARTLYNLPLIIKKSHVWIAEGEKAAQFLTERGFPCTTNSEGAQKWQSAFGQQFTGKHVYILPDNDEPGEEHALTIARNAWEHAHTVKIVRLEGLPPKGDVVDFFAINGDVAAQAFEEACQSAREWTPLEQDTWMPYDMASAYEPRPPREYIVDDLIPLPSVFMVFGASGSLKSMVLMDMAACIAAGRPWLEPNPKVEFKPLLTHKSPVLWLNFDNPTDILFERFAAIGHTYQIPDAAPIRFYSFPTPHLDASQPANMQMLKTRIKAFKTRLLIVDNLQTVRGTLDENSAEMGQVIVNFRQISEQCGCGVCLIHHVNKEGGYRGSSAIENLVDFSLHVDRDQGSRDIVVWPKKMRHAEIRPFAATFEHTHKFGTSELETARFWGFPVSKDESGAAMDEAILEVISNHPEGLNQTGIITSLKDQFQFGNDKKIIGALSKLKDKGVLTVFRKSKNAKVYTMSNNIREK